MLVNDKIMCNRMNRLILKYMEQFQKFVMSYDDGSKRIKIKIREIIAKLLKVRNQIGYITWNVYDGPLTKIVRKFITIDQLDDDIISEYFTFKSRNDLHRLFTGFEFKETYCYGGHRYTGEEVFLVGL